MDKKFKQVAESHGYHYCGGMWITPDGKEWRYTSEVVMILEEFVEWDEDAFLEAMKRVEELRKRTS
jgi:hypothetical protein